MGFEDYSTGNVSRISDLGWLLLALLFFDIW